MPKIRYSSSSRLSYGLSRSPTIFGVLSEACRCEYPAPPDVLVVTIRACPGSTVRLARVRGAMRGAICPPGLAYASASYGPRERADRHFTCVCQRLQVWVRPQQPAVSIRTPFSSSPSGTPSAAMVSDDGPVWPGQPLIVRNIDFPGRERDLGIADPGKSLQPFRHTGHAAAARHATDRQMFDLRGCVL